MKPQSAGGTMESLFDTCFVGDCREVLKTLIAKDLRVHMWGTSPPYWGLRDYGMAGQKVLTLQAPSRHKSRYVPRGVQQIQPIEAPPTGPVIRVVTG
jgi:hypothetical protein